MAGTLLTVRGGGREWQVDLDPQGTVIGRNASCDVVIDSPDVSRRHAKILQTPSHQWIIEDLGSSNGTLVNGERIESAPISAGDMVEIGPACLSLGQMAQHCTSEANRAERLRILVEDFGTEVFYDRPRIEDCPTPPCPERLRIVKDLLSEVTDRNAAYAQACCALADDPKTAAVVFRLPTKPTPMPSTPEVLAYRFGGSPDDTATGNEGHPSHYGFRVSHRLLEAVRVDARPLMTKSIFTCDTEITVSLLDEHSPRALICVSLGEMNDAIDLLYVDIPIKERAKPNAEEVFAFVQAVAKRVQAVTSRLSCGARSDERPRQNDLER